MPEVHLMTFVPDGVDREALIAFMDRQEFVTDYHTSLPSNLFIVVSPLSARDLATKFDSVAGLKNFMFAKIAAAELGTQIFGWMPTTLWEFVLKYGSPTSTPPVTTSPPPPLDAVGSRELEHA